MKKDLDPPYYPHNHRSSIHPTLPLSTPIDLPPRIKSKFVGVTYNRKQKGPKRWCAKRSLGGRTLFGGNYETEEDAARASDDLLRNFKEPMPAKVKFNFPEEGDYQKIRLRRSKSSSGYYGVWKKGKKWRACRTIEGIARCGGTFDNKAEAAKASDELVRKHGGKMQILNFPGEGEVQIESYHALDSDSDTESDEMKEESEIKVKREPGTGTGADSKALSFQDLKRQQDRQNKKSDSGKPQFISEPYRPHSMKQETVQFRLPPNVGPATNHQIQFVLDQYGRVCQANQEQLQRFFRTEMVRIEQIKGQEMRALQTRHEAALALKHQEFQNALKLKAQEYETTLTLRTQECKMVELRTKNQLLMKEQELDKLRGRVELLEANIRSLRQEKTNLRLQLNCEKIQESPPASEPMKVELSTEPATEEGTDATIINEFGT